ncbi:MAG: AAA family ATPase [Gemmatimonadetes bacterium]|nr:AAA family ATPase [Gemmatimonadota bacterium]
MPPLPSLELRCYGPPTARVNGEDPPPEVLWRKHLALLIYLALSPDRARTRDHLRGLLWPENDEERARRSLNEAVRRLRRCLGQGRLRSEGDLLVISEQGLTVDETSRDGAEFLEGFAVEGCQAFEEWMSAERERRRARSVASFLRTVENELAECQFPSAMDAARLALRVEPLSEAATRLFMRAAALSGDSARALAVFHEFAGRLEDAIGEKPGRELVALADRIRRQAWQPAAVQRAEPEPPLVGRASVHAAVFNTATEALAGGPRTVLVTAAPGMGRTRLLDECAARLALEGAVVASARPLASDVDARWSTMRLLLRGGLDQAPGLSGAAPGALAVLAALSPGIGSGSPAAEPRDTAELAAALSEALIAAAEEQAVVLLIDDAHFADSSTLSALLSVMPRLKRARVALLLSSLDRIDDPAPELLRLRSEIGQRLPGVAVRLKPLTPEDLAELVARAAAWCTEPTQRDRLSRRLAAETGGSPFFAVTLLRGLERSEMLREDLVQWPPPKRTQDSRLPFTLPDLIGAAIRARLVELDESARQVLAAAALSGREFDLDLIAAVTQISPADVEEALAAAEGRHLARFDGQRYVFPADIIGKVVRTECLTPGQRRNLSRRTADLLAGRTDVASQVLRAELLARTDPGPQTFDMAVGLAREAQSKGLEGLRQRAIRAAERAAGKTPTPQQSQELNELMDGKGR